MNVGCLVMVVQRGPAAQVAQQLKRYPSLGNVGQIGFVSAATIALDPVAAGSREAAPLAVSVVMTAAFDPSVHVLSFDLAKSVPLAAPPTVAATTAAASFPPHSADDDEFGRDFDGPALAHMPQTEEEEEDEVCVFAPDELPDESPLHRHSWAPKPSAVPATVAAASASGKGKSMVVNQPVRRIRRAA